MGKKRKPKKCAHGKAGKARRQCAEPDYTRECIVCEAKPVVCCTELCGPCTFGEAATAAGNW